jgi:hypothetical protein
MVVTRAKRVTTALEKVPKPSWRIIEIKLRLHQICMTSACTKGTTLLEKGAVVRFVTA